MRAFTPFCAAFAAQLGLAAQSFAAPTDAPADAQAVTALSAANLAACAAINAPDSRLACFDALAHRPPDRPAVPAPVAASAASFGLSQAQQHLTSTGPQAIHARIASITTNRAGVADILLDNTQTWHVEDDDGRLSAGDEVTIKRAALGSFLLVTRFNHAYRVRRIN